MKKLINVLCLALLFCVLSCNNEEGPDTNIIGTWKFGSLFVDGLGSTASGTINFQDGTSGQIDLWYIVENDTITKNGNFTYIATTEQLTLNLNGDSEVWTRAVNKSDEQEFHFDETINQVEYNIIFDMIPE